MVFYSSIDGHGPADTVCCGVKPGRGSRLLTVGAPGHSRRNGYQNGDQFQGLIRLSWGAEANRLIYMEPMRGFEPQTY